MYVNDGNKAYLKNCVSKSATCNVFTRKRSIDTDKGTRCLLRHLRNHGMSIYTSTYQNNIPVNLFLHVSCTILKQFVNLGDDLVLFELTITMSIL